ncbi:hypothetical protein J5I95_14835 [Candidatus Poribacteria bacterium]|nr:hypothetical protein [Candidatus Poribacteria bacterium]
MLPLNPSTHSVRQALTRFVDIYVLPNYISMLADMLGVSKAEVAESRDQTCTERTAHFGLGKYLRVVLFPVICLLLSSFSVAWGNTQKISGYFLGDYYYVPRSHHGELEERNGFQYRRVYFTYDKGLSSEFSTRFRLEMNGKSFPTARQATSKLEPFLKHGYLKWEPSGWRTNIYFGLSGTPTWRNVEKVWGYRSVAKTVLDLQKMGSSADFGVALQGDIDASNLISYHLMIANGTGTRAEIDKNKKISFSLAAKPITGVTLEGYIDRENAADLGKWHTLQGFLGYQQERFRFGIQLANQTRQQADVDTLNILASSVFGAVQLLEKKVWAFARFDRLFDPNPNAETIPYIPFDNTARSNMILVGLDWAPTEAVHIIPNLIFVFYDKPDNIDKPDETIMPRLTVFFTF